MSELPEVPRPRIILLGASNLTLGFPLIVNSLRHGFPGPLEIIAAHGHGRSFGMCSKILFRSLPGITQSQLLPHLQDVADAGRPSYVLVTDIGNDILYGAAPDTIAEWLDVCLRQLCVAGTQAVMTQLPLESAQSLSPTRFNVARRLFFPNSTLTLDEVLESAAALSESVSQLAERYKTTLFEPPSHWYGLDPIHIRHSLRAPAWSAILNDWSSEEGGFPMRPTSLLRSLRLWSARPVDYWSRNRPRSQLQPVCRFGDGTTVTLY
ncbi:MAG: hypothetical protein CMJ48_09875 [Planctomycetaceae bacterium]|nr:hypothetical protein [Planctomycetaceae bacterium]